MDITSLASNSPSLIILTRRSLPSTTHNKIFLPQRHGSLSFNPISCSSSSSSSNTTNDDNDADSVQAPTSTPSDPVGVKFRRRSRRQSRRQRDTNGAVSNSNSVQSTMSKGSENAPPKKWEDMTLTEKAIELYVGEKGALFWLNKFAYASIFIMIGGWIAFRFVGPALNLYQLDSPPLSPSQVFKGSS
ncbi:putative transmembrane protein [Sesbania bispinosa]|nr:putative transmembrane protein [Sesbania bispinosa]